MLKQFGDLGEGLAEVFDVILGDAWRDVQDVIGRLRFRCSEVFDYTCASPVAGSVYRSAQGYGPPLACALALAV